MPASKKDLRNQKQRQNKKLGKVYKFEK